MLLYLLISLAAPAVAEFYGEPSLTLILRVAATTIIINSLAIVQRAILTIAVDFRRQTIISLTAIAISGSVGIALAYMEFGVWALIFQNLTFQFISMVGLWCSTEWRPKLEFSLVSFRELFGYGSKLLISALIDTLYSNLNSIIIGRRFSSRELGYYNRAYAFAALPCTSYSLIVTRVLFPSWCGLGSEESLRQSFKRYISITAFVIIPLVSIISMLSSEIVEVVLTERWLPSARYMKILSFALLAFPLTAINDNLLKVKGRTKLFLRAEIIKKIIGVSLTLLALRHGVEAICYALVISSAVGLMINIYYTQQVLSLKAIEQIKWIGKRLTLSLFALIATTAIKEHLALGNILMILCCGTLYTIIYLTLSTLWRVEEIDILYKFIETKR